MTLTLTATRALVLIQKVAAEQPGRVIGRSPARYVQDGQCSCLVAHVLHRAGWSTSDLQAADALNQGGGEIVLLLPETLPAVFDGLTSGAARVLDAAQAAQDDGRTWAAAAQAAAAAFQVLTSVRPS